MKRKKKLKDPRVHFVIVDSLRIRLNQFWHPNPFDKKSKFIPSSVDCLFNKDYYSESQAARMLRSL